MAAHPLAAGVVRGAYPERLEETLSKLDELGERLAGTLARRMRARLAPARRVVELAAGHDAELRGLSDAALKSGAGDLSLRLRREGFAEEVVSRCFAVVRETARREVGERHYDVQLMGGWVLLHGMLAEMETGEGKTLAATLPAATAALAGIPVHVVTVNDYLAARDAEQMGPLYRALGLSVGLVTADQDPETRRRAYGCDVTYCTNKQVAFDYLRDRITLAGSPSRNRLRIERLADGVGREPRLLHRGLHFAIVDEADSVLVDEARTPLIIADRTDDPTQLDLYRTAVELARGLVRGRDFEIEAGDGEIWLLEAGAAVLAQQGDARGGLWQGRRRREALVRQALSALHSFHRDQHYLIGDDAIQIIDEYTGRLMPDRSWEHGLHQMIELKEGLPTTGGQRTLARISYQRFFRRYLRLAGMTGTAHEAAAELGAVYRLPVVRIPTHRPLRRHSLGERVFRTQEEKWSAVVERLAELHRRGRPVLVGTRSVAASELLSERLRQAGVPHCILNARQDREEALVVARAGEPGRITVTTNMAGRGTDIRLAAGVAELGGLHVVATERHDAGRIDRQLFGRCGRQGDPGEYEAFASLEDELLARYGDWLGRAMSALAGRDGSRAAPWVRRFALRRAQRAAERLHARTRRDLLARDRQFESFLAFAGRGE